MLVLSLLLLVVLIQTLLIEATTILPEAVSFAIESSFNESANNLHIIIETDSDDEIKVTYLDTLQTILDKRWTFCVQINVNSEVGQFQQIVSDYNLWFIDSYKAFRRLFRWIRNYHRDSQLFHFIVLRTSKGSYWNVMENIFLDFLKLMVGNVNIIVEINLGEVLFYTFHPYQKLTCRSAEPSIIFRYDNDTITEKAVSFFPVKANNFHGCPLRVRTRNELVLTLGTFGNYTIPNQLRNYEMSILEYVIMKELSLKMNFSFDMFHSTASGLNSSLAEGEFDVVVGSFANGPEENHFHSTSVMYFLSWLVIALQRRPDVLRTLVWLLVPFNSNAWICTLAFLILTTGCIVLVRKSKRLTSIFQLHNSGGLEILSVTIGASVEQLPRKNSLRFAFVVLSLGALILRSAYLGKLFDAYRGYSMVKPPLSVLELLAKNYTIYAHDIFKPVIKELIESENIHFGNLQRYESSFSILSNTIERNAFVVSFIYIYTFHTAEQRKDIILKTVLRQQVCMFFQQHSIIVPRVNEIIMGMEEAGILHNLRRNYDVLHHNTLSSEDIMNKPIPLVLERFEFTFYLFALLNAVAIVVFVVELLWKRYLKLKKDTN